MRKSVKWIIIAVLLVGIIAVAYVLYNKLADDYGKNNLDEKQTQAETENDDSYAAADFTVLDYEGNAVKISDYKGKPVVLNFWATWCYYCKQEMADFDKAAEKYPDVQFLMVNATDGERETISDAKEYIEQEGYQFEVFFDTKQEAVNSYYVTGFPSTYFIDKDGNLVTYGTGMLDTATLEKGIEMITQ